MAAQNVKAVMEVEKETPGTIRFKEQVAVGETAKIGTLYVPKATVAELGNPKTILVVVGNVE